MHEDVYAETAPVLEVRRTVGVFGASREGGGERFDMLESVLPLGHGIESFRSPDTPAYQEMLEHICRRRGWDGTRLRGYHCRIEYPIYSAEVALRFEIPQGG